MATMGKLLRLLLGSTLFMATTEGYSMDVLTTVEITFQAEAIMAVSSHASFERETVEFLNKRISMDDATILRVTIRSQSVRKLSQELAVELEVYSSLTDPSYNVGSEVLTTFRDNSNALDKAFQRQSLGLELGPIVSVQGADNDTTASFSNDNPTRSPTPESAPILPTLPPGTLSPARQSSPWGTVMTKSPTVPPTPQPATTKTPINTAAPTLLPTTKAPAVSTKAPTPAPFTAAPTMLTKAPTLSPTLLLITTAPTNPKAPTTSPTPVPVTKAPTSVTKPPILSPTSIPLTKDPSIMITKVPTISPTPAPFTKAQTKTKAPTLPLVQAPNSLASTPNPTGSSGPVKDERVFSSGSPSSILSVALLSPPSSLTAPTTLASQTKSNLVSKSYQTVINVKLFGLVNTIQLDEIDAVEQLTQEFIQETMPAVKSVIVEVSNAALSEQASGDSVLRRRKLQQQLDSSGQITLLTFGVDGEGWSTNEEILETLHFDDLMRHGFLTRYNEYISRLQASSGTFSDLDAEPPGLPPVTSSNSASDSSQGRSTTVVVSVLAASFGTALLAGIICTVMVFGRRRSDIDDETESASNDKDDGSLDVEYTDDQEEYLFDDSIPRIISPATRKYPTQQQRGNIVPLSEAFECCSSLQSPSMGSVDVDNWSPVSGPTKNSSLINKNQSTMMMHGSFSNSPVAISFTIEVLDEFEANIGSITPELMTRRRLFDEDAF